MAKSNILKILRLFSLEEMLKLIQGVRINNLSLKKAAGEEFISINPIIDGPKKDTKKRSKQPESNVLSFPASKAPLPPLENIEPIIEVTGSNAMQFYSTEDILWQRELSRDAFTPIHRLNAIKGYKQSKNMIAVKSSDPEGKEKIRFALTNGVLVDKKQD